MGVAGVERKSQDKIIEIPSQPRGGGRYHENKRGKDRKQSRLHSLTLGKVCFSLKEGPSLKVVPSSEEGSFEGIFLFLFDSRTHFSLKRRSLLRKPQTEEIRRSLSRLLLLRGK